MVDEPVSINLYQQDGSLYDKDFSTVAQHKANRGWVGRLLVNDELMAATNGCGGWLLQNADIDAVIRE